MSVFPPNHNSLLTPHPLLPKYHQSETQRRINLNEQFDQVAPDYDWISQVLSFGSGNWYRTRALRRTGVGHGGTVLDVACGPGTLSICAQKLVGKTGTVIGLDPSLGMLRQAREKGVTDILRGMAEHLPFPDGTFDFVLMGYALRHVSDLQHTFNEYWRVLKPGGRIVILEISRPNSPVSLQLSRLYLKWVVPGFSYLRTHNPHIRTLMRYFWDTIQYCVAPETILLTLRNSGFVHCQEHTLVGGLIRDYTGQKS